MTHKIVTQNGTRIVPVYYKGYFQGWRVFTPDHGRFPRGREHVYTASEKEPYRALDFCIMDINAEMRAAVI